MSVSRELGNRIMDHDDPIAGEFASWRSYSRFARSVRHHRRYVWTDEESAFLATVRATIHDRDIELPQGMILFRAQRGIDWRMQTDTEGNEIGEEPSGYGPARIMRLARSRAATARHV